MLAVFLLPAGAVAFQAGLSALTARQAALQEQEGARIVQSLRSVRDAVTQMREVTRSLAASGDLLELDDRGCSSTLREFAEEFPQLDVVSVLSQAGTVRCANIPGVAGSPTSSAELIRRARIMQDAAVGFVETPHLSDAPVIASVAPIPNSAETGAAYVAVTRKAKPWLQMAASAVGHTAAFAVLADREGHVQSAVGLDLDSPEGQEIQRFLRERMPRDPAQAFHLGRHWFVGEPLQTTELYLLVSWRPISTGWRDGLSAAWSLLVPILLWLGAVAAAWFAVDAFVARPLLAMERLARAYARGEDAIEEERQLRAAPSEIASLRRTLAALAKTLRGREARLAEALQEERALLREVNHRVKNNLQMVASILSIQARASSDPSESRGLSRAQDRVQLLALAHSRIYASGEVRLIALDELAAEIVRTLVANRYIDPAKVKLELNLTPARTSVDRAVPFAFLIGEALLSIIERISEQDERVSIVVAMAPLPDGRVQVEVAGPENVLPESPGSTTIRLIQAFAKQIGAEIAHQDSTGIRLILAAAEEGNGEDAPADQQAGA